MFLLSPKPTVVLALLLVTALVGRPVSCFSFPLSAQHASTNKMFSTTTSTVPSGSRSTSTALSLVPEQGNQLVAAFYASTASASATTEGTATPRTTATAVVVEEEDGDTNDSHKPSIFSRLALLLPKRNAAASEQAAHAIHLSDLMPWDRLVHHKETTKDDEKEAVLYPIVGFRFVATHDDSNNDHAPVPQEHIRVLPTSSHPSCRLVRNELPPQQVYGWYSPVCPLDSIFSDTYCDKPQSPAGS